MDLPVSEDVAQIEPADSQIATTSFSAGLMTSDSFRAAYAAFPYWDQYNNRAGTVNVQLQTAVAVAIGLKPWCE